MMIPKGRRPLEALTGGANDSPRLAYAPRRTGRARNTLTGQDFECVCLESVRRVKLSQGKTFPVRGYRRRRSTLLLRLQPSCGGGCEFCTPRHSSDWLQAVQRTFLRLRALCCLRSRLTFRWLRVGGASLRLDTPGPDGPPRTPWPLVVLPPYWLGRSDFRLPASYSLAVWRSLFRPFFVRRW